MQKKLIGLLFLAAFASLAHADTDLDETSSTNQGDVNNVQKSERSTKLLERITVVGSKEKEDSIPGSIYYMEPEELEEAKGGLDDIHRILRRVPGVNVQEEDGFGLRPNIGFRGVSSERSSRITLMEDGVLIAPAPYSAPSAYFFPPVGRMSSLEVLKGSGLVKYGPYTTGGSLNLLSTPIPQDTKASVRLEMGQNNAFNTHAYVGDSSEQLGALFETYQNSNDGFKDLDTGGDTGFQIQDYLAKFRVNTPKTTEIYQELEFKLNYYDQDSNETYVGLTQSDFDATPFRRYAGTQLDNMLVDHRHFLLTHYAELTDSLDVTTFGYYNRTARNWYKLEKSGEVSASDVLDNPGEYSDEYNWITGAQDSPDDALTLRNNNREYDSIGVQTVVGKDLDIADTEHEVEFSVRYHEDEEDRFQDEDLYKIENLALVQTTDGAPGTNANRIGSASAWATYLRDSILWNDFTFTPGVRYEYIAYTREDFGKEDSARTGAELETTRNIVQQFIPGFGVNYELTEEVNAFFGVHRGFSPPGPSGNSDVKEEESVNYEWGANYNKGAFRSEGVIFYNDYDNLLGADTVSSGGQGTGDLFNGGEATVFGVESSIKWDLSEEFQLGNFGLPIYTSYTYTDAQFDSSFDSDFFGLVSDGDAIPYIPEHQIGLGIAYVRDIFRIGLDGFYQDAMATVAGQSGTVSQARTDSYFTFDLEGEVKVTDELSLFASIKNLFDEEYVVARRPAGARPGAPRLFFAGVRIAL